MPPGAACRPPWCPPSGPASRRGSSPCPTPPGGPAIDPIAVPTADEVLAGVDLTGRRAVVTGATTGVSAGDRPCPGLAPAPETPRRPPTPVRSSAPRSSPTPATSRSGSVSSTWPTSARSPGSSASGTGRCTCSCTLSPGSRGAAHPHRRGVGVAPGQFTTSARRARLFRPALALTAVDGARAGHRVTCRGPARAVRTEDPHSWEPATTPRAGRRPVPDRRRAVHGRGGPALVRRRDRRTPLHPGLDLRRPEQGAGTVVLAVPWLAGGISGKLLLQDGAETGTPSTRPRPAGVALTERTLRRWFRLPVVA
ncbi:hypothetical protein HBB16_17650 [Pseudonocardia sp. MCCB 268]|nr:hypothetical protein [Pseudonocardia cytotoxica]